MRSYFESVHDQFRNATSRKSGQRSARNDVNNPISAAWTYYLSWFNGNLADTSFYVHYDMGEGKADHTVLRGMCNAVLRVVSRGLPERPEAGKWCKRTPAADWICLHYFTHGIMQDLMFAAFGLLVVIPDISIFC